LLIDILAVQQINIHEAKTHLSRYKEQIKRGETLLLCERNKPFAEIRPLPGAGQGLRPKFGVLKKTGWTLPESFFEADAEVETLFGEED